MEERAMTLTEAVAQRDATSGRIRMTTSEAFVESLVAEGVRVVPGIVGSAYMDALDLFPRAGIRFVSVAHEQNAAHMADGYGRVSGQPTVCIGQNGPGITNFVTAVAAAYWAHTPMVVVTPSVGSMGVGLGGFQETEQLPIFSKITKWQVQVNRPERMAELLRRAFYIARTENGPVQVDIPRDYFYGELETEIYSMPPVRHGPGPREALEAAADRLAGARHPVIIAGGGVIRADAGEAVRRVAELLTAPVATTYLHNDAFPYQHPLGVGPLGYMGSKAAMRVLSRADVVLALGTRLGPFGTLPQYGFDYWPQDAEIIQVDVDHRVLGLTKRISLGIVADAREFAEALLVRLVDRLSSRAADTARLAEVAAEKAAWDAELERLSSRTGEPISPRRGLKLVTEALPDDAIVTTDIGNISSVANSYIRPAGPRQFLAAMMFGNCGYSYPTALGAKLGRPDRPVVAFVGDGAWGMSLAEVMTAVREDIPVVAIVWNNGQWGAEKKNQIDYYGNRFVGTNLRNPDFAAVARAMGADGYRVEREADIVEVLRAAIAAQRPAVIDLVVDSAELGEPFRRDALRKPVRLLPKYADLVG
jgi:sulfoacetaldehyde acetyltransferase